MFHLIPAHQSRPSDDPIFALNAEATARASKGEAIVNATVGSLLRDDGTLAVLPTAARVVREVPAAEWAAYAPIAGSPEFLSAVVASLFGPHQDLATCAAATATPGGSGALRHALANYLEPDQTLLTTSFYWGPYQTLTDEGDRRIATFPMFDAAGGLDVVAFDKALCEQVAREGRALVFLNDPCHNPTGYTMRPAEWRAVVERLVERGARAPVTLLVDMAYAEYAAGDPRAFLPELRPLLGKVGLLFAWSASKTFTHYGLRVGALVACVPDERERKATAAAFSYSCRGTWSNCTRGGMHAVTRMLTEPALKSACDAERGELKALLGARVAAWNARASARGLRYPRYEGGFFVTVFADNAAERALRMKEKGVFVVPSKTSLRVALCGVAERDIPRLVDAIADA